MGTSAVCSVNTGLNFNIFYKISMSQKLTGNGISSGIVVVDIIIISN